MNFKEMDNESKIAAVVEGGRYGRAEILLAQEYINALHSNDKAIIEEYETFGDSPRRIIQNKMAYEQALSVYGFTGKKFDEHGWLADRAFADCESFHFGFGIKGCTMGANSITIGRSPNNKWTYGLHLAAPKSGSAYGLSVFSDPHDSRRECLRSALTAMIEWHTKEDDRRTAPVTKEARDMLDEIMGRKPKQLSLW